MIFSEKYTVQKPIISYVCEQEVKYGSTKYPGWNYIKPEEIENYRSSNTQIILEKIFIPKIKQLNTFLSDEEAQEIRKQLENVSSNIEGNFKIWQFLKGLESIYIQKEKRNRDICLIDTNDIDNNDFHVTEEFKFTNGVKTIRQDVVFFINGIPVVFIEAKAPHKIQGMDIALEQVKRYHSECPQLLATQQAFVLTHLIQFLYGATWNVSQKNLYNWKEETKGDFEVLVKSFFDKKRLVKLITDYVLFTRKDDQLQKVILRPHQMRAVEKIIQRAEDKQKKRGLIWHTQGSGKTYTMIVTAKKLMENPLFENPTVILLVDRNELESQLFGNIQSVGIEHAEVAQSKEHLKRLLRQDKRGLIVSMIHKFEGMEANINTRENIFVLIDEAHRTTSGDLGNYLMGALPNATYIGFTGTPIDKTNYGKGTFFIFGKDDPPNGYLDKYSIAESIEEGTTVPLHYALAPNELTIDKETLEKEFFSLKEAEGISDVEELNKILDKSVNLKNVIKSRNRIEKIAKYIAEHYKNYVEPLGYKAFVVAVDREACAIYKEELDKYLPPEYSKVVYSSSQNDPEAMSQYYLSEEEEKRIRKDFIDPDKMPKILIVTNKLLTGFDAPILYCMYLDKPMRDHVLLQTIARVNRPYEDKVGRKKPAGFIVDFIGIFSNLQKALAFDSTDIEGIVEDIEKLKTRFQDLIDLNSEEFKDLKEFFTILNSKTTPDKKIEWILEYFFDEEKRKLFYQYYRELANIYNIISPDEFLRQYLSRFNELTRIYKIIREAYDASIKVDKELTDKIIALLQENVHQSNIKNALDIYEINDTTLKKIEQSQISDQEKVFNLAKSIITLTEQQSSMTPLLISIGERVEELMQLYKERQKTTEETLEELKHIIEEINQAKKEQAEKGMDGESFFLYWLLGKEKITDAEEKAREMKTILQKYPYWQTSQQHEREVKKEFIGVLLKSFHDPARTIEFINRIVTYLKGKR
ncbi:MAG: type I restriction endonuclease subunit R [Candidatus Micrarchaeia archaeon]